MPDSSERCSACRQEFGFTLGRCRLCGRQVCSSCAVRLAGNVFCGRACAHSFVSGGTDDIEEAGGGGGEEE